MNYGLAYAVGFHPWEGAERESGFVNKFSELFDREEAGRSPPHGKALDLGCESGSGIWGIQLARRGWHVASIMLRRHSIAQRSE